MFANKLATVRLEIDKIKVAWWTRIWSYECLQLLKLDEYLLKCIVTYLWFSIAVNYWLISRRWGFVSYQAVVLTKCQNNRQFIKDNNHIGPSSPSSKELNAYTIVDLLFEFTYLCQWYYSLQTISEHLLTKHAKLCTKMLSFLHTHRVNYFAIKCFIIISLYYGYLFKHYSEVQRMSQVKIFAGTFRISKTSSTIKRGGERWHWADYFMARDFDNPKNLSSMSNKKAGFEKEPRREVCTEIEFK